MELTYRQRKFIEDVIRHFLKSREPVNYRELAKEIGLSNSATYDMLKLLEKKGYVESTYAIPRPQNSPGRASVLFSPTQKTVDGTQQIAQDWSDDEEREALTRHIVRNIVKGKYGLAQDDILDDIARGLTKHTGNTAGRMRRKKKSFDVREYLLDNVSEANKHQYEALLDMLSAISSDHASPPFLRCLQIMTVVLIACKEAGHEFNRESPIRVLANASVSRMNLASVAALAIGLCINDEKVRRVLVNIEEPIEEFQSSLKKLKHDRLVKLQAFIQDACNLLGSSNKF